MKFNYIIFTLILYLVNFNLYSQEVPILSYGTDINGQVQLEVASTEDNYYILNVRHSPDGEFELATSLTLGEEGTTIISEPLEAYPIEHYQVLEHPIATPADTDGDGLDDMSELAAMPSQSPLNFAQPVDFVDGTVSIISQVMFKALSLADTDVGWAPFLNDKEFLKFVIVGISTDEPEVYFINSETHFIHASFTGAVGIDFSDALTGEIIYHPTTIANNGTLGAFSFNYSFGEGKPFEVVRKTHELIGANMPFAKNNIAYFLTDANEDDYEDNPEIYDNSRIPVLYEDDVYAEVDYLALNVAEGFGFFRLMNLEDVPGSKDIVLYESLPNTLPRVGGIMTSFIQTPLSHVNLRAIQDNLPNAFIRDPLSIDSIANLLDKYIYYRVDQDEYFIREATVDEVNAWYEDIRPEQEQYPAMNLSYTEILPLDEVEFGMADGFGAKATNVATMRDFGFPEGTIPDGFAIPFYFYREFMEYNGFFEQIEIILANPDFQADLETRIAMLKDLRTAIKAADMPQWMLDELQTMHDSFPEGTAVRCRSSTNNEDLPGFSGAGLYTSKTQHLDEGHISKSIKQVYASMWNFRAYDERDFYRIDQFLASMGVLCHPNYSDEKANGVGVSLDPIYQTENTFFLNTQLGEDLVTNPDALSIPEEILLDRISITEDDYLVIRYSNLMSGDELIMTEDYLDQMRNMLRTIHDEFQVLYGAVGSDEFAIDIEYKITVDDQLIIKQARPWASFWTSLPPDTTSAPVDTTSVPMTSIQGVGNDVRLNYFPNPAKDNLNVQCADCDAGTINIINLDGQVMLTQATNFNSQTDRMDIGNLPTGIYILTGIGANGERYFSRRFVKE